MAKKFKTLTAVFSALFIASLLLYLLSKADFLLTFVITFGVFCYHFIMRLIVGLVIHGIFRNDISYELKWFKEFSFERRLYSFLRVKKWKEYIPTYLPDSFSMGRELSDIAKATCQAELVHEIIIIFSFAPILLTIPFGDFWIFALTSLASALFDLVFVIVQRYNRPRILKLISKGNKIYGYNKNNKKKGCADKCQ